MDKIYHWRTALLRTMAVLAICTTAVAAHALGTIEGQVLDDSTDKPIPGAIVVIGWNLGSGGIGGGTLWCPHVETATTDSQGRYQVGRWMGWWAPKYWMMWGRFRYSYGYKRGYVQSVTKQSTEERIYLHVFSGSKEEWMHSLGGFECFNGTDDSVKNLYRIWSAIAEDQASIAETDSQRQMAQFYLRRAKELLVNRSKPVTTAPDGSEVNVDPSDSYKPEDLLK